MYFSLLYTNLTFPVKFPPIKGEFNDFERFVLRIDNYINLQYQIIANRLGYIVGFCSYVLIAWLVFARAIPISPRFFLFLMTAPFPIIFGFVKFNFALWVLPRRLELGLKKKPLNGCDCDVNRLPLYGEVGWLSARFKEFYTCILYGFICRLLLTYCFSTVCVFIFFGFFN